MRRILLGNVAFALLAIHAQSFQGVTIRCRRPSDIQAVSKRQTYIYDGGELQSFLIANNDLSNANSRQAQVGSITFVTGTTDGRRIIGVEKIGDSDGSREVTSLGETCVYSDTVAEIPGRVSDEDALTTASASLVGIHCSLPTVEAVGGSSNEVFYSGKAVVMGGNEYACFVADGLAALGIEVSLVSTGGAKTGNQVNVLEPSVDIGKEDDVGFSDAVGEFDSIIDTIGNEQKGILVTETGLGGGSTVVQLLRSRHKCDKYVSTLTKAQELIKGNGVLFGPGKANGHIKEMQSLSPNQCIRMVPSAGFGPSTLQTLLEKNIVFSGSTMSSGSTAVRGWSLKEFWEESSWPRDSSGADVRYGLPVIEEEEFDELEDMFRRQKSQIEGNQRGTRLGSEGGLSQKEEEKQTRVDEKNPYVTQIRGVDGLSQAVTSQQRDTLIFVAMRNCRTCKSINHCLHEWRAREPAVA
mmetsp:Transcript_10343/g.23605  ORF Transcript_10343/g.23605 Transcript_10343/m.23605 type:complete len:467 (+) Transcript_10343:231-1631(+)